MARKPKFRKSEPTQTTEKGFEIPIPKRRDFLANLKKATKTVPPKNG
jgi:hypothetical protein